MEKKQTTIQKEKLRQGFEELAFGSVTDAVRLLFEEDISKAALDEMNLFNVAEIKRMKGGGMEIKFVDRLKALQCLEQLTLEESSDGFDFYRALENSAALLRGEDS